MARNPSRRHWAKRLWSSHVTECQLGDMDGIGRRLGRLILAALLWPVASAVTYFAALYIDGEPATINNNGAGLGVLMIAASVFVISRIAAEDKWSERAGITLGLGTAFFLLTWVQFGDPSSSADAAPHLVWFAACVAAFTPAVILIPASKWAWSALRLRRGIA